MEERFVIGILVPRRDDGAPMTSMGKIVASETRVKCMFMMNVVELRKVRLRGRNGPAFIDIRMCGCIFVTSLADGGRVMIVVVGSGSCYQIFASDIRVAKFGKITPIHDVIPITLVRLQLKSSREPCTPSLICSHQQAAHPTQNTMFRPAQE